jgi:hypothetical protein
MSFMLLVSGSTRLLRLRPHRPWSMRQTAFRLSGREIVNLPTLCRGLNVDLPTTLVKSDGPSEPQPPLVIHEGAPTPVLVLLSSALVPGSTNELHSSRRKIERHLPPSILVPGPCLASPLPSPPRKLCLPSPGSRAMARRPMVTLNPLRLHPSRRARRDLGRRYRFQLFPLSGRRVPTVRCLSLPLIVPIFHAILQAPTLELPPAFLSR